MNNSRTARFMGLACVIVGAAILILWGGSIEHHASSSMVDFKTFYCNTQVMLKGHDPYNALEGSQLAESEGVRPREAPIGLPNEITFLYPPTALIVFSPIAFLSWNSAHLVWMLLNGGGLILAGFLMWELSAEFAPVLAGVLIGLFLANSEGLLLQGNVAGIVVTLCMIAAWCFLRNKFATIGVICLAASLGIKPHDSGLVWLFFLVAGGVYRKRAIQAVLVTTVLGVCSLVWMAQVAPHWTQELRSNLVATSMRGAANDPGPTGGTNTIVNQGVNLQTVLAVFRDEPAFYNSGSILLCGALLIFWWIAATRIPNTLSQTLLSLAFLATLSMLPVYHRHHDAKLLALAVPACAILSARRGVIGTTAVCLSGLSLALNADVPCAILTHLEKNLALSTATLSGKVVTVLLIHSATLALLAMAVFYLWAYCRIDMDTPSAEAIKDPVLDTLPQPTP
jgi:hypothetical protein